MWGPHGLSQIANIKKTRYNAYFKVMITCMPAGVPAVTMTHPLTTRVKAWNINIRCRNLLVVTQPHIESRR